MMLANVNIANAAETTDSQSQPVASQTASSKPAESAPVTPSAPVAATEAKAPAAPAITPAAAEQSQKVGQTAKITPLVTAKPESMSAGSQSVAAKSAVSSRSGVSKDEMQALYDKASKLTENGYTKRSWALFTIARDSVSNALKDSRNTDFSPFASMLNGAMASLKPASEQVASDQLDAAITKLAQEVSSATAKYKNPADYAQQAWNVYQHNLAMAQHLTTLGATNPAPTSENVANVLYGLCAAEQGLDANPATSNQPTGSNGAITKEELQSLIVEANNKHQSDYTSATWSAFEYALDKANNAVAAQADCTLPYTNLTDAMSKLLPKAQQANQDLAALKAEIKRANKDYPSTDAGKYAQLNWNIFQHDLGYAQSVASKENPVEEDIYKALLALQGAERGLIEHPLQPGMATGNDGAITAAELQDAVDDAYANYNEKDYTPASWSNFDNARSTAKAALPVRSADFTILYANLKNAEANLVRVVPAAAEPAKPAESVKPVKPAKPAESVKPAKQVVSAAKKAADPTKKAATPVKDVVRTANGKELATTGSDIVAVSVLALSLMAVGCGVELVNRKRA